MRGSRLKIRLYELGFQICGTWEILTSRASPPFFRRVQILHAVPLYGRYSGRTKDYHRAWPRVLPDRRARTIIPSGDSLAHKPPTATTTILFFAFHRKLHWSGPPTRQIKPDDVHTGSIALPRRFPNKFQRAIGPRPWRFVDLARSITQDLHTDVHNGLLCLRNRNVEHWLIHINAFD